MRKSLAILALLSTSCVTTQKAFTPSVKNTNNFGNVCVVVGIPFEKCNCMLEEISKDLDSDEKIENFLGRTYENKLTNNDQVLLIKVNKVCSKPPSERNPKKKNKNKKLHESNRIQRY